ncbi:WhiB family transcriptional regulator [Streptomyces lydicamycinicus]|uniref:WhiB family transcriptional regulator n=1 Tax=Streptomyces lydicamycinicus TaxID=1546107 RepID=UPI003C2B7869
MSAIPCEQNPELWFAESRIGTEFAKSLCLASCPKLRECAELGEEEPHGVWGGTSPEDRHQVATEQHATRERELNDRIAELITEGMSVRAMAGALGMPRRTLADRIKRYALAV